MAKKKKIKEEDMFTQSQLDAMKEVQEITDKAQKELQKLCDDMLKLATDV